MNIPLTFALIIIIGLPILTLSDNIAVHFIGVWAAIVISFNVGLEFNPNPLKIAIIAAIVAFILYLFKAKAENFVVTANCDDIRSDEPEKGLDCRVDKLLQESMKMSDEINSFLQISAPDKRE